jgi:hypothetical protein
MLFERIWVVCLQTAGRPRGCGVGVIDGPGRGARGAWSGAPTGGAPEGYSAADGLSASAVKS